MDFCNQPARLELQAAIALYLPSIALFSISDTSLFDPLLPCCGGRESFESGLVVSTPRLSSFKAKSSPREEVLEIVD